MGGVVDELMRGENWHSLKEKFDQRQREDGAAPPSRPWDHIIKVSAFGADSLAAHNWWYARFTGPLTAGRANVASAAAQLDAADGLQSGAVQSVANPQPLPEVGRWSGPNQDFPDIEYKGKGKKGDKGKGNGKKGGPKGGLKGDKKKLANLRTRGGNLWSDK